MEEWILERIKENSEVFNKQDVEVVESNLQLIKNVYLLALKNSCNIDEKGTSLF